MKASSSFLAFFVLFASSAIAQKCPHGDGDYCGSYVQKTHNYLYNCINGNWTLKEVCDHGCYVASAGNPDRCLSGPDTNYSNNDTLLYGKFDENSTSCPQGHERDYCGGLVGKDPSKLYSCSGSGVWTEKETCPAGCKATPSGHNDYCASTSDCADGDRFYCGRAIGKDVHHLYECTGGLYKDKGVCPNGCFITTNGENDYCLKQSDSVPGFFINAYTVQLLKDQEGFYEKLHHDDDEPNYYSIGYGHLCKPTVDDSDCGKLPTTITEAYATIILSRDIKPFESCICTYVSVTLNDYQYGVLVAHAFERRHDCQYFRVSNLRTLVNSKKFDDVPNELLTYATNSTRSQQCYQDLANAWSKKSDVTVQCPSTF